MRQVTRVPGTNVMAGKGTDAREWRATMDIRIESALFHVNAYYQWSEAYLW